MKILILGGSGMLGHRLWITLQEKHDVWITSREVVSTIPAVSEFPRERIRTDVDARVFDQVSRALASIQPDLVINCIGLIKQLGHIAQDPLFSISINALLPHRISLICRVSKIRMIHISTDCVFSGDNGNYKEDNVADATDIYGRTKYLGEVHYPHCVTLRTSIVGREIKGKLGLVEWFLAQEKEVNGFTKAIFSGLTTNEFSRIIADYVIPNSDLSGLYHVSSEPISKFDMLNIAKESFNKKVKINPYDDFVIDRSLDSSKFKSETGYSPPTWPEMISEMAKTQAFYDSLLVND
jgi:dTDP-4-dehydrorhamnose reductase